MHVTSSAADWYAARAAGVAAYVVLTTVIAIGLTLAGKAQTRTWPRFAVEEVHRFGGLLVGWLVTLHVVTIALDAFLPFSLVQLVVPGTARYRPLWTGLGIVAAELLVALALTNRYRERLPYRVWRRAHYANFAVWTAATVHGIGAGTDRSAPWLAVLYGVATGVVLVLLAWRLAGRTPRPWLAAGGAVGCCGVLAALLVAGPLRKHPRPWNAARVTEQLSGAVTRSGTPLQEIVSLNGSVSGGQKLLVRADLLVEPRRIDATSLQIEYLPSGDVCRGRVTAVGDTAFAGRCRLASGAVRYVDASWGAGDDGGLVGTLHVHA